MYIDRRYRPRRRSPLRYLLLLAVIAGAVYLLYTRTNFFESPLNPLKPTATPTRTLISFLAEAEAFYAEGKLEEAAAAYAEITQLEPENDRAFRWWAKLLALRGHTAEAVKKARQVRENLVGPLVRAGRVVTPSHSAWEQAGSAIAAMARREGRDLRSVAKSLVNDFLLAASCRESGAILVTDNTSDFKSIRKYLRHDHVSPWPKR